MRESVSRSPRFAITVSITEVFPLLLEALARFLKISINCDETCRVLEEANGDDTVDKTYTFHSGDKYCITGQVDAYEPEIMSLRVEGARCLHNQLYHICKSFELLAERLDQSVEQRVAAFRKATEQLVDWSKPCPTDSKGQCQLP